MGARFREARLAVTPDLHYLTISEASALIRSRQLSPVELVQHHLERIDRLDRKLNSFLFVAREAAMARARAAEARS
jgi:Asp-tRNA(Asn)/Glu-tRNA(Gln) amidotransferase A subunit family amidase